MKKNNEMDTVIEALNSITKAIYGVSYYEPKNEISEEEYDRHDCTLSAEDGCRVCERWAEQHE